jgi:hypothetical protein
MSLRGRFRQRDEAASIEDRALAECRQRTDRPVRPFRSFREKSNL